MRPSSLGAATLSMRPLVKNPSVYLCLLVLFIVLFVSTSGCAVSETSSAPKEETSDAPKEAAQQKVDAAQLLADVQTLSDDSMEGRKAGTAGQGTTMVLAVSVYKFTRVLEAISEEKRESVLESMSILEEAMSENE